MPDMPRREFVKTLCLAGVATAASASAEVLSPGRPPDPIRTVHVVFKTHLDLGFTAFARDVVKRYFSTFIPKSIELGRQLRERGQKERFIWTTGSWLIYEYLEQAGAEERRNMEQAIAAGDIRWHALPFTTHTELMDAGMARFALSLSAQLDRRFGKRTIAAKMTDVPGHTRSLVHFLAEAGVKLLHLGLNPASRCPDVPRAMRWSTGESSVVVLYADGYGATHTIPHCDQALTFAHSGDNHGPPTEAQVIRFYRELADQYPGADIRAGTLDDFARALPRTVVSALPSVTSEIGDTWIHGVGSDPAKTAGFREYLRQRAT